MKVIILCAGYAVRLYPLTINTPKSLLPIGGKSMLDRQMEELETFARDIDEVVVVSNDVFYNKFSEWAKGYKGSLKISVLNDGTYSNETRLGAIGDTQFAIDQKKIDDEILLMVSDNYFTFKLKDYYDYYRAIGTDTVLGTKFDDLEYLGKNFGVAVVDKDGIVTKMVEKPGPNPPSNIGVYAFYFYSKDTTRLIRKYLDEGNNKDAPGNFASWLATRKPVHLYQFAGKAVDIGTLDAYHKLDKELSKK